MKAPLAQINYTAFSADLHCHVDIETYTVAGEDLHRVGGLHLIKANRFNSLAANIQPEDYPAPTHTDQPLVVACGMGTDSIAMLIAMKDRGIRPDVVQWADTGSERAHTYRYVNIMIDWLKANDFPPLLIVRKVCPLAGHRSLYDQLWNTSQLPSPAFHRNHSCSAKWKLEPQRDYHRFLPWLHGEESRTAIGFSAEETNRRASGIAEAIGFSAEETSRKSYQLKDGDGYVTYYPLQEWDMTRQDCVDLIADEGLPQPGKSACFFCPMMQKCEVESLRPPELIAALAMEQRAEDGGKLKKIRGLRKGVNESWAEWLETPTPKNDFIGLVSDV